MATKNSELGLLVHEILLYPSLAQQSVSVSGFESKQIIQNCFAPFPALGPQVGIQSPFSRLHLPPASPPYFIPIHVSWKPWNSSVFYTPVPRTQPAKGQSIKKRCQVTSKGSRGTTVAVLREDVVKWETLGQVYWESADSNESKPVKFMVFQVFAQ